MDVQTENTDPPPCESQQGGKIRKGFKLFGKRKPGNIFSIRSKGDGNNKSPVNRSKTLDGLSETTAPVSEQEPDKEKGQEVSQGESEQAEEEPLGEDGILAAATARTSFSSVSSAKSLSFLSLLRGGRRGGGGDRQVHTVSQPVGRHRRGLKGLFGNVKFHSKDKEDKEEAPPSPLLMSSRANSVEIIKEDLTLTPKSPPRSLDSPEMESCEPVKSLTSQDSSATSPSEMITPQKTAGNVSRINEHVPPLLTPEPPLIPGEKSLSSLLADISSLLTFDSISGGGDIMADVEAEWGKASSAISPVVTEVTPSSSSHFSKPTVSSPLTSASVSTSSMAKPYPVAFSTTASTQSFTSITKKTSTSSPIAKPSTIITTLTKSSTLTTHSVKSSSDSSPASGPSTSITIKSTPAATATTKPLTTPVTLTSLSAPIMSFPSITSKSTPSSTSTTTTAPPNTPATVAKAPSISPTLTSTASKLASEVAIPPQINPPVSTPISVATSLHASAKPPPVTHSPPNPISFTQPPPAKLDSTSSLNLQSSSSSKPPQSSAAGEFKAPVTVTPACTVTTQPSSLTPVFSTTMTKITPSTPTPGSISTTISKPAHMSMDLNKTPPLLEKVPDVCSVPTQTAITSTKTQPSPVSVPTPFLTLDKIPPMTKPTPPPVSLDKMPPAPTPTPAPTTPAVVSTAPPATPAQCQIPVSQTKAPPAPAQIPISVSKEPSVPAQMQVSQSKAPPQIPVSVSKDASAPARIPVFVSTDRPAPACIPVSVSTNPPACIPISLAKDPPVPARIPVSVSKDSPTPYPVTSPPSTPVPSPSEAPASAKMRGGGQASVDGQLACPSSTDAQVARTVPSKTEELHNESRTSLQGPSKERRTPQVKASGLSKIPVVGGGRIGKLPVRDSHHVDGEASKDPPTPVLEEERPHFNIHDAGSKDKISHVETSKHTQEESQQPHQPKALTSLPRDSKIPVKHGAQSHAVSHIPQAKEPPRTKIPVSKVPVRRVVNKSAAVGGSAQIRK
ncbi:hypothetical protein PAMA_006023 [Pampus argenteus]